MCVKESNLISVTPRVLASSIRMRIISCAMPFRLKFLRTLTFIKWTRLPSRCRAHLRPRRVRVHRARNREVHVLPTAVFLLGFGERLPALRGGLHFNSRTGCHCNPLAWKRAQSTGRRSQGMSGESESTRSRTYSGIYGSSPFCRRCKK